MATVTAVGLGRRALLTRTGRCDAIRLRWIEVVPNTYPPDRLFFVILDSLDGEEEGGEGEQLAGLTQAGWHAAEAGALAWLRLPLSRLRPCCSTRWQLRSSKFQSLWAPPTQAQQEASRRALQGSSPVKARRGRSRRAGRRLYSKQRAGLRARKLASMKTSAEVMCVHVTAVFIAKKWSKYSISHPTEI